jgi:hypothetical protein
MPTLEFDFGIPLFYITPTSNPGASLLQHHHHEVLLKMPTPSSSLLSSPPIPAAFNKNPRVSIILLLLVLVGIITKPASACLTYSGVFPFDEDQPFVAEIIDNGVRTCWINMTYTKHWRLQVIENGGWRGSEEWKVGFGGFSFFVVVCVGGKREEERKGGRGRRES